MHVTFDEKKYLSFLSHASQKRLLHLETDIQIRITQKYGKIVSVRTIKAIKETKLSTSQRFFFEKGEEIIFFKNLTTNKYIQNISIQTHCPLKIKWVK